MKDYHMILSKNHMANFGFKENGNILVLGQVGTYKTRGHVLPNIMEQDSISMVIADTKGELQAKTGGLLREKDYSVKSIDFDNPRNSRNRFNPFNYIRTPEDILEMSAILISEVRDVKHTDPYWDNASMLLLNSVMAYLVYECRPEDRTLGNLHKLIRNFEIRDNRPDYKSTLEIMFDVLKEKKPECFAVKQWESFLCLKASERTVSCVVSTVHSKFSQFLTPDVEWLTGADTIDFDSIGKKKTALFVSVSDVDRSKDKLVSMFYSLLLNRLRTIADKQVNRGLPVHVHFFMDDFATNVVIPNFSNYISCLRSREISFTLVLQSENQLKTLYGEACNTIIANCAYYLFLGSRDLLGCQDIAKRMNVPLDKVLYKPKDSVFILSNFSKPLVDSIYDVRTHPLYKKLESEWIYPQSFGPDL